MNTPIPDMPMAQMESEDLSPNKTKGGKMKISKILTLTALLTTLSMAQQKEALVLGVSNYMGTKYDLAGVKKDVPRMAELFRNWGFHVTVIKDADSMNLESYLANYANLKADDNFIFYYSGHGYHTKDTNGDEADGEDEALVLSDGERNELFIDDALFGYLNAIKAKKMVVLDSCHSGTAFKAFGNKPKPKSIVDSQVSGVMKTRAFRPQQSKIGGEYIVFAAAQDTEESLDTGNGGLFTNAFLEQFSQNGTSEKLMNLRQNMENSITKYCKITDSIPHHPKLSASSNDFKYTTINDYFKTKTITRPTTNINVTGKPTFNQGELLDFKIDTLGNSGYLTIFSIEDNQPFTMYQSTQPQSGVFNFKDFNIQPSIECYKACKGCASEKSVVYVAFSPRPIKIRLNPNSKTIETEPHGQEKAFRHQGEKSFITVIKKFETTIY